MEEKEKIDFAAMPRTAIKVITSPAAFFREMSRVGGFVEPMLFMMVMTAFSGLVNIVLSILGLHIDVGIGRMIAWVVLYPFVAAVLGFIVAAIVFVLWRLIGSHEPYETAYRCMAYLAVLLPIRTVIGIIPSLGALIVVAVWVYFFVVASIETHKIPARRAWLMFGIFGAILIILLITSRIEQRGEAMKYRKQMEQSTKEMQKK